MAALRPGRWASLVASLFLDAVAGSPYFISAYLPTFKTILGFDEIGTDTIASTGNLGMYLSFWWGFMFDRFGPRRTLFVGALFSLFGYSLFASGVGKLVPHDVASMSFYAFLWSEGSGCIDSVVISVALKNFPNNRGFVVGLIKSLFGLSASLYTVVWGGVFGSRDTQGMLTFLAILVPSVCLGMLYPLVVLPPAQASKALSQNDFRKFTLSFIFVLALVVYILLVELLSKVERDGQPVLSLSPPFAFGLIPLLLLITLLLVPLEEGEGEGEESASSKACSLLLNRHSMGGGGSKKGAAVASSKGSVVVKDEEEEEGEEEESEGMVGASSEEAGTHSSDTTITTTTTTSSPSPGSATLGETFKSLDYWMLFLMLFLVCGAGLTIVNNLGDQTLSLGGDDATKNVLVVLFSVFSCLGRLTFGFASDLLRVYITRPQFLVIAAAAMTLACVCCTLPLSWLFPGVCVGGLAYGGVWAITPSLLADRYGTKSIGAINATISLAVAFGSYAFSDGLAANLYNSRSLPPSNKCEGVQCFSLTFWVLAGCNTLGVGVAIVLARRLACVYDRGGNALEFTQHRKLAAPPTAFRALDEREMAEE